MTLKVRPLNREIHKDDAIQLIRKHIGLGKNIGECIAHSKVIFNFAGEKKGTFLLVITIHS